MTEREARSAVAVGGILVGFGAFLPWAFIEMVEISGLDAGVGIVAIPIGAAIVGLAALGFHDGPTGLQRLLILGLGVAALVLYGWGLQNVDEIGANGLFIHPDPGTGIWVGGIGAVIAIVFSRRMGKRPKRSATSGAGEPAIDR